MSLNCRSWVEALRIASYLVNGWPSPLRLLHSTCCRDWLVTCYFAVAWFHLSVCLSVCTSSTLAPSGSRFGGPTCPMSYSIIALCFSFWVLWWLHSSDYLYIMDSSVSYTVCRQRQLVCLLPPVILWIITWWPDVQCVVNSPSTLL